MRRPRHMTRDFYLHVASTKHQSGVVEASSPHLHAAQSRGRLQGAVETRRQKLRRRLWRLLGDPDV